MRVAELSTKWAENTISTQKQEQTIAINMGTLEKEEGNIVKIFYSGVSLLRLRYDQTIRPCSNCKQVISGLGYFGRHLIAFISSSMYQPL